MYSRNLTALSGVDQDHRLPMALEEGYFNVDEMTFEDLVTTSVEFAGQLKYYNSKFQVSGDWRSFLAANEIVIMALMINKDTDGLRAKFRQPGQSEPEVLSGMLADLVNELDRWLADLKRSESDPARRLVNRIENTINASLRSELLAIERLADQVADLGIDLPVIDRMAMTPGWRLDAEGLLTDGQQARLSQVSDVHQACAFLRRAAYEFLNAFEHLKTEARTLLPLSLKTQSHDPAVSLFITFLKLYRYAQDKANGFTQRHLDFYYREILKTQPHPRRLESVILGFSIANGSKPVVIPAGRNFLCAKDEKLRDIIFSTRNELVVSDARVAGIYTLRLGREALIAPECDMGFVTRINKQVVPIHERRESGWPVFGATSGERGQGFAGLDSLQLGLGVASKVLFLEEGDRRIELEIGLQRLRKPVSSYLEELELAPNRTVFRQGLYALLRGWMSSTEQRDWSLAAPADALISIKERAQSLDRRTPVLAVQSSELGIGHEASCAELLATVLAAVERSSDPSLAYIMQLQQAESAMEFRDGLGALMIHFLLEHGDVAPLLAGDLDARARQLGCSASIDSIKREMAIGRERLLKKYFGNAFTIHLSTESGWLRQGRYDVLDTGNHDPGLKIVLALSADAPPIVGCNPDIHGEQWQTRLPIVKLTLNPEAPLNVYSLLEPFCLQRTTINVQVAGVRNIVAYNNISQLDPSKPFFPFGPNPTTSSYLALAAPEAARKQVSAFTIHLYWGDLPSGDEGFDGYYEGYNSRLKNGSFTTQISVLSNGSWQPQSLAQMQTAPLFAVHGKKLVEHRAIKVRAAEYLRPICLDSPDNDLDLGLRTRNGFLKLTLASPEAGFGHQEFPLKLSETLESNARKRSLKKKGKLPRPPYTPLLNKLAVDYAATATLEMHSPSTAREDQHPDRVYRLHAFGTEAVLPNSGSSEFSFFKRFDHDGNLLIALTGTRLQGTITLYFSLADDSERSRSGHDSDEILWSYLGAGGWTPLAADRIVSDGTKGFLCSGIVSLDLPEDMVKGAASMGGDYFWLRISSDQPSSRFCSLRALRTHAVALERRADDGAVFDAALFGDALQWQAQQSIPGLLRIEQPDGFSDTGKMESRRQLVTRVSERLRHRSRAITSWDFERLVLEAFPMVGNVICLPGHSLEKSGRQPGCVLLIVTPRVNNPQSVVGGTPKLSAVHLNEIQEYLELLRSPYASIEVSNPVYEWVQVRCSVVLEQFADSGQYVDQLNDDINRFLNPWDETGYRLKYCQTVKREDLYSYIYNLDYVRYVTDFSMLHITRRSDGYYLLGDTVRQEIIDGRQPDVTPSLPWSVLMPLPRHHVDVAREIEPKAPDITGIRELEIGSTFIIGEH